MHNPKVIIGFQLVLLGLIFSGCSLGLKSEAQPTPEVGDGGLLSGISCGPPCFWGMTPGITTQDEAIQVIKSKGIYKYCSTFDNTRESGLKGISCTPYLSIHLADNSQLIGGIAFVPTEMIGVGEVIEKYGAPSGIFTSSSGIAEHPKIAAQLLYDKDQIVLTLHDQAPPFVIDASTQVITIAYEDEVSYLRIKKWATEWKGYGEYNAVSP